MTPRASRSRLTSGSESPLGSGSAALVMVLSSFDRTGRSCPLAQHELLDLAGGSLRDLLEAHLARHLVGRQQGAAMRDELGGAHRDAALELDEGERRLAPFRIGPRHHCAGHHRGVAIERILHLQGADVLPAGDNHVLAAVLDLHVAVRLQHRDRKSTRLNSSHEWISYAVFCLKKKKKKKKKSKINYNLIKQIKNKP